MFKIKNHFNSLKAIVKKLILLHIKVVKVLIFIGQIKFSLGVTHDEDYKKKWLGG